jgi:hypothetical protein
MDPRPYTRAFGAVLLFQALVPSATPAQELGVPEDRIVRLARGDRETTAPSARNPPAINREPSTGALKSEYRIRLTSAWPQYGDAAGDCLNGGQEVLEGTLIRTNDGGYTGAFTRTSGLSFCGTHSGAPEVCSLSLNGHGLAGVAAYLVESRATADEGRRIELVWRPRAIGNTVSVRGTCPVDFNQALQSMWLGATHAVDFVLPVSGAGRQVISLEDYGWVVEIE